MGRVKVKDSTSNDNESATNSASGSLTLHPAQTAWRVAVGFLVFTVAGLFLDRAFGSEPIFSIIGVALAVLGVIVVVYQYVNQQFPNTFGGKE